MDLKGLRVLVIGLARSGVAAVRLLHDKGAHVVLNDSKPEEELSVSLASVRDCCDVIHLGAPPDRLVEGCDLIVLSPGVPDSLPFVGRARQTGIPVIGELELGWRFTRCPVAAITGTNGKTTTTALLGHLFAKSGFTAHVVGNIGHPITAVADRTQPRDRMSLEVSSFQLETIDTFRPAVSAILNITEDHLNRHRTMDDYIAMKCRIFENQRDGDLLVLNADNEITAGLGSRARCPVMYFSRFLEVPAGCCIREDRITYIPLEGEPVTLGRTAEVRIAGGHNLENALAASTMALALGADPAAVRYGLATFEGVEHRLEFVGDVGGVRFINDSKATNPDSAMRAIEAMMLPTILIAGGSDKGSDFAPLIRAFGSRIRGMVVLGETADRLLRSAHEEGFTEAVRADDMADAVRKARDMARPGYNVLLSPACASFDMFEDFEHRGRVFKQIVRELGEKA
ncbi:MAG: UDP-N-acetylmuramoyl-L-alanine--D-glutamate ligase [Christensenellales bacterium]